MFRKLSYVVFLILIFSSCTSTKQVLIPDWINVPWGPFPLTCPAEIKNPVLTAADVSDRQAEFVADPFLFHENDLWYLFFEVYDRKTDQGDIGLASSPDGLNWKYDRIILDEPFHLSYPYVFRYNNEYYMMPETHQLSDVRIYKAVHFPYEWKYQVTILNRRKYVDPSIFFYNNYWWLFVSDTDSTNLYLYFSTHLTRGWREHPMSPIVKDDLSKARPGGRSFVYNKNKIIRFSENKLKDTGVRAFEVDLLTPTQYREHEVPESPVIGPGNPPVEWFVTDMHQFAPWWTGNDWLVAFDGMGPDKQFSIGICISKKPEP
jgi:hypothetical protein